jgi:cysteine desulfurase/selenocysteine lyase
VRTGHHCAQPVLRHFGYESAVRPTLGIYNSESDIDRLVRALRTLS